MRFSLQLPTDRVERPEEFGTQVAVAELARAAEAAGFDACFVTDHPIPDDGWLASGGHHALDPFVALAFAAAATERIRLQTHVLILAYRNPFLTAKAAATLDVLSGGRLTLGVAAGYLEGEFAALGVDFDERNELCDEAIETLRLAFQEDGLSIEGRHFRAAGNSMRPQPLQKPSPPIWVGGNSRRAIRRAVELGDGWLPFPSSRGLARRTRTAPIASLDDLRERLDYAREHAERVGRTDPLDVCFMPHGSEMWASELPEPGPFGEQLAELEALGVNWLVTSVSGETRGEWCERVARFGRELIEPSRVR